MIDLILKVDEKTGLILEKIENVSDKEILNWIKTISENKDGNILIQFEEYE